MVITAAVITVIVTVINHGRSDHGGGRDHGRGDHGDGRDDICVRIQGKEQSAARRARSDDNWSNLPHWSNGWSNTVGNKETTRQAAAEIRSLISRNNNNDNNGNENDNNNDN